MSKMTLLEMTQNILSAMDSDEVNSIHDTVESEQVIKVIKETFYDLFGPLNIPEHNTIVKLSGVGDLTRPNYLKFPDNVKHVAWIKYRNDANNGKFQDLEYYAPDEFFRRVLQSDSDIDNTQVIEDFSGVSYYIKNNQDPHFYTVLDDKYIVTNSYDSTYDSTLQASKTFCWGWVEKEWEDQDDFIPPIDSELFPFLLAEAKSVCFINFKQVASQKEEQRSRRQRIAFQHRKFKDNNQRKKSEQGTNYARNR